MSGIIIEGVCATGKTTIIEKLTKRDWYIKKQTKVQLSEYLTERIIENIQPTVNRRAGLLEEYVNIFEKVYFNFYNSRFKDMEFEEIKPFFIAERFHLTHSIESASFRPFKDIDNRLKSMDMKLVILTMDKKLIKERILDTFIRRPETWKNYCLSFGTIEDICKRYWLMQEKLLKFTEESKLDKIIINTSKMEWDKYVLEIENRL